MSSYWNFHDEKMLELKRLYAKISKQTKNRLQEIFDSFNIPYNNLYGIADISTKKRINTYIDEWRDKKLLNGYFEMLCNSIYKRKNVKNSEILDLLIYSAYIEEQNKLDNEELRILKDDASYYYQVGQQEVNKKSKVSVIPDAIFLSLISMPDSKGYVWANYKEATIRYNAEQILRQAVINIQQQKELEINSNEFENIIKKQQNAKLCVNKDTGKISGNMDNLMVGINNQAKVEGIVKEDEEAKVGFVAIEDKKTTNMCKSLDGQEFSVKGDNEFTRYSETHKGYVKYKCKGLVLGLNLPPINDHFHYCRSTVQYISKIRKYRDDFEAEDLLQYLDINNYIKKDITEQKEKLIQNAFKNAKIRNIALNNDIKKIYIYGQKSKFKENEIYFNVEWKYKRKSQKYRTVRHEVGHAIDNKYKNISCGGELTTALEIDKMYLLEHKEEVKSRIESKEYQEYAELSDILSGITNNQIKGKYHHKNIYWQRENALEKETFADLFAIAGEDDIQYLKVFNAFLPNTLKAFDGLIRRLY